jgi:tRNA(adenine34) deaminase
VVSACRNSVERNNDSTCHAEIQCIRAASKIKKNWRLENCTLYTTLEPCDMCMGAIMSARIARCVYAASDNKIGFTRHTMEDKVIYKNPFHSVIIKSGLLENESKSLLRNFFQSRRKIKPDQAHSNDSYSRELL